MDERTIEVYTDIPFHLIARIHGDEYGVVVIGDDKKQIQRAYIAGVQQQIRDFVLLQVLNSVRQEVSDILVSLPTSRNERHSDDYFNSIIEKGRESERNGDCYTEISWANGISGGTNVPYSS